MENLADSLSRKFKTTYPSSEECCIYRVPQLQRCLHPSGYTPQMVSIGPLHHGKEELKAMEENKLRYLHFFLQRTKVSMVHFLEFIREKEEKLRNCYAETIHLESDEFVTMILLDAVFLIELFLRSCLPNLCTVDDPLFHRQSGLSFLGLQMRNDLYLLENQLPLFILSELFELAQTATDGNIYSGLSFMFITSLWLSNDLFLPINDQNLVNSHFFKAQHFVDLLILCLHPSPSNAQTKFFDYQNIPGAKELHQAGIKFKSGSSNYPLDIKYNKEFLEIPFVKVYDLTERLYRNVLTFENMHVYPVKYFNEYVQIMCSLADTPKDADILIQNGIIGLADSEKLSTVFHSLWKDCIKGGAFEYAVLAKELQAHCKSPWNKWKANLKQNYFNTPWASISVLAAVILLLLTVMQTVCAFIAL